MVLPGPRVDLTLKRFFVALVWLDLALALTAAYYGTRRPPKQSPVGYLVSLIVVMLTTLMGVVFQLAIPVSGGLPGSRLYYLDDWALHIGMAALACASIWLFRLIPRPVLVFVVLAPSLTEFLRLCFMLMSREHVVDPLQLSFDILRAIAQLLAAVSLVGMRWLVMADVGTVVWKIGRLGWSLRDRVGRTASRVTESIVDATTKGLTFVSSSTAAGARAQQTSSRRHRRDDDTRPSTEDEEREEDSDEEADEDAPLVADRARDDGAPLRPDDDDDDDEAAVGRFALIPESAFGVASAEKDVLRHWALALRTALENRERVLHRDIAEADGVLDHTLDNAMRLERAGRKARALAVEVFTMRSLRCDPVVQLIWRRWGNRYSGLAVIKLFVDLLALLTPVLLRVLMDAFSVPTHKFNEAGAYAIVSVLVIATIVGALCRAHYSLELQKVAMHSRSMLSIAVYRHALALKRHEVTGSTAAGEISTHMTVDIGRITDQIPCFNDLWALPCQALLALYLLYTQVSFAFLAGLLVTVVLIPLNMKLAKRIGKVNQALLASNDERVLRVTEVLSNFKAVKMCGWSGDMLAWIAEPRAAYVKHLRWIKLLDAWCVFFWATTPIFVSLSTFAVFVWMGGDLTPGRAIAALSLFSTLITPLNAYPWVINGAVEANVSRGRLSRFLRHFDARGSPALDQPSSLSDGEESDRDATDGTAVDGDGNDERHQNVAASSALPVSTASFSPQGKEMATMPRLRSTPPPPTPVPQSTSSSLPPSRVPQRHDDDNSDADDRTSDVNDHHLEASEEEGGDDVIVGVMDVVVYPAIPAEVEATAEDDEQPPKPTGEQAAQTTATSKFELRLDSFLLRSSELLLVVGEPGSGKSTLLYGLVGEALVMPTTAVTGSGGGSGDSDDGQRGGIADRAGDASQLLSIDRSRFRVALVPQQPFLLAGSIRDNILFGAAGNGEPVNERRYRAALEAAALDVDLREMPQRDATDVGERGTALSGGQRLRVALARAYYADADVYLLDDPLGCLDASVCRHVVNHFMLPLVREQGKAVVLVTHRTEFFVGAGGTGGDDTSMSSAVARVYQTGSGRVVPHDPSILATLGGSAEIEVGTEKEPQEEPAPQPTASSASGGEAGATETRDKEGAAEAKQKDDTNADDVEGGPTTDLLADVFHKQQGALSWAAVRGYFYRVGVTMCALVVVFLIGMQVMRNVSDWYVAYWVGHGDHSDPQPFLNTLLILALLNAGFAIGRSFLFAVAGLRAATATHDRLLESVLKTSITFFTDTSSGALINRLSKDVYTIDDGLPFTLNIVLAQFFLLVGAIVVIVLNSASAWLTLFVMTPAFVLYAVLQRPYRYATRAVKRVESEARSPVIDLLLQMVEGGPVLRAAGPLTTQRYLRRGFRALDGLIRWTWNMAAFSAWFSLLLQLIGALVLMAVAFTAVAYRAHSTAASAAAVGLSLAYVGPLSGYLSALLGAYSELEKTMISVERVHDFLELPTEADIERGVKQVKSSPTGGVPLRIPPGPPPPSHHRNDDEATPLVLADDHSDVGDDRLEERRHTDEGSVRFAGVSMSYHHEGRLVLENVSLDIPAGSRVAIVGRTGAGKSSVFAALLRLRPLRAGRVFVDGDDTTHMEHDELRQRIAVLPQDPFVRHGTVRANLLLSRHDFGNAHEDDHDDSQIKVADEDNKAKAKRLRRSRRGKAQRRVLDAALRRVLDDVGLGDLGLGDEVGEQGASLSAGQRQLLGIARVMLSAARVVVMDEPNASLDAVSAARVEAAVHKHLQGRTVLVITHKLHGLAESYDHVIVMQRGGVAEHGPPASLLRRGMDGALYQLVHATTGGRGGDAERRMSNDAGDGAAEE